MIDYDYVDELKSRYPTIYESQSENLAKQRGALLAAEEQDFVGVRVAYGIRYWKGTEIGKDDSKEYLALFVEIMEDKIRPLVPFLIDAIKFTPSQVQKAKTSHERPDGMILHYYMNQDSVQIELEFNKDLVTMAAKKSNQRMPVDSNGIQPLDDL